MPVALREITERIYSRFDRFALDLGRDLQEAYEIAGKRGFERWVDDCLPFGVDKARRLRAIHLAYRELPVDKLRQLPRPMQALFAFTRLSRAQIEAAIESGVIHPDLTVKASIDAARQLSGRETRRHSEVDLTAARLVSLPVEGLSDRARALLVGWLDQSSAQPQPPHSSAS